MTLLTTAQLRERLAKHDRRYILPGEAFVLHVWDPPRVDGRSVWPNERTPGCFQRSKRWAHLFGEDAGALERKARSLGVRRVVVSRRGQRGQHVDLCGKPLERAIAEAQAEGHSALPERTES